MTKESLEQAVTRLKSGDKGAFDYIYDSTYKVVFFVVHSVVRQRETAEDVVQDVYITAFRNMDKFDGGNTLAWLTTIAKRLALNAYKRNKREKPTDFQTDGEKYGSTELPSAESMGLIAEAEKILSSEDFEIVVMCAIAGYRRREVAKLMDMPVSTGTHRYTTALKKLKRIVDGVDDE